MSTIVWLTSVDIRSKREKLDLLAGELILAQSQIEKEADQNRWAYYQLLSSESTSSQDQYSFTNTEVLLNMVKNFRRLAYFENLEKTFSFLEDALLSLQELQERCLEWAKRKSLNEVTQPHLSKKAQESLRSIIEEVEEAYGQQRLDRVLRYRKFIKEDRINTEILANDIIKSEITSSGLSMLKPDVGDLALLFERLRGVSKIDYLIELKDNRLRTLLVRLQRSVSFLPEKELEFKNHFLLQRSATC